MNAGYLKPEPYAVKVASTVLLSSGGESPLILEKGPEMAPTYPTYDMKPQYRIWALDPLVYQEDCYPHARVIRRAPKPTPR